jgi:hypothetical protein
MIDLIVDKSDDYNIRVQGFVVDTISEVVEDQRLLGSLDFVQSPDASEFNMEDQLHAANVDCFTRGLYLERHVAYSHTQEFIELPL